MTGDSVAGTVVTGELVTVSTEDAGLTDGQVAERVRAGLANNTRTATSRSVADILRANILTRFNALLGSLFLVILVVGPLQDGLFGLTLIANSVIGIVQELRAKRTLDHLKVVTSPTAQVTRNGRRADIGAADLVVDDIMHLATGDQAVVDAVVLVSDGAEVDESLLTGESHPVVKEPGDTVMSGSFVVAGSTTCRVTAVGEASYAATLAAQAKKFSLAHSELRDGINRFLQVITWIIVPTAALLAWSQFSRHAGVTDAIRGSVAGTVTMVPEGLVLLSSVAFTVGALRLARRRVLARELPSIEGLARVDTLCIDKTGTLTTGRMTVDDVEVLDHDRWSADAAAALCRTEERQNATMQALAARFAQPNPAWIARHVVPFSSRTKWSGALFAGHGFWLIGAPDVLLPAEHAVAHRAAALAESGARVLLVATGQDAGEGERPEDLTPVALLTLVDEIRPDAESTLAYLAAQGVSVKVISGDHPGTVAALARRVGLDPGEPLDARSLPVDGPDLSTTLRDRTVFGRVSPDQKRAMVAALRADGHVVAMTGDGVNDVLALKDADVGIAMGSGSPATRAVAQLVLLDDAFTAVPSVIGEGRRVIANMERVANLFLTKTVYATILAITVGVARLPFPFLPRHLTLISTLTIGVPAFILALAPNEQRARPHFVARVVRFALPAGIVAAGATYLAYSEAREDSATSLIASRTLATIVLFAVALWVLAILVRLGDRRQSWVVPAMAAGMVLTLLMSPLRTFFALQLPRSLVLLAGVGAAALSGVTLELGWKVAGWLRPKRRASQADDVRP
jgi:cation-transporting ATPase E